jgi:hypothetical protein
MATRVTHTPFGDFIGKVDQGVAQYLGIKYALLKDRLSVPEMVHEYGNEPVDATEYGLVTIFPASLGRGEASSC